MVYVHLGVEWLHTTGEHNGDAERGELTTDAWLGSVNRLELATVVAWLRVFFGGRLFTDAAAHRYSVSQRALRGGSLRVARNAHAVRR